MSAQLCIRGFEKTGSKDSYCGASTPGLGGSPLQDTTLVKLLKGLMPAHDGASLNL